MKTTTKGLLINFSPAEKDFIEAIADIKSVSQTAVIKKLLKKYKESLKPDFLKKVDKLIKLKRGEF